MTVVSMIELDMLAFLFGIFGLERYTPLRADESCSQTHERKGVKGDPVVHAGIAGERKAKERKEIGVNAERAEGRITPTASGQAPDTERSGWILNRLAGVHSRNHD